MAPARHKAALYRPTYNEGDIYTDSHTETEDTFLDSCKKLLQIQYFQHSRVQQFNCGKFPALLVQSNIEDTKPKFNI